MKLIKGMGFPPPFGHIILYKLRVEQGSRGL